MKFCFYYSAKKSVPRQLGEISKEIFLKTNIFDTNNSQFIIQADNLDRCFHREGNQYGYVSGYVRDYSLPQNAELKDHNNRFFYQLDKGNWPLNRNFTGSFSAFFFDESQMRLVIANDAIGIYPVYYYQNDDELIICSSLILLASIIKEKYDPVGIVQSAVGPDYCNYGRRTIIDNVSRLLPGEFLEFSLENLIIKGQKFDTLLYQEIQDVDLKAAATEIYKKSIEEHEIATRFDDDVNLALSGGLDSRVLLASLPENLKTSCLTYGDDQFEETRIARRCSKLKKNSKFTNYPIQSSLLYPDSEKLSESVLYTEAVGQNEWFSIYENVSGGGDLLLFGEMTEAIMGRNLGGMKGLRFNDFLKILFNRPFDLKDSNEDDFEEWKKNKLNKIIDGLLNNRDKNRPYLDIESFISQNNFNISKEKIIDTFKKDLSQLFDLIEKHGLKKKHLYDELFSWFTHGRISMSRQILLGSKKFYCISPTMSVGMLRSVSRIPPELRIFSKLINAIFKYNKECKNYCRISTAATPLIPQSSPLIISFIVRGLRNKIDGFLTKRILKQKNPNLKYRLINSLNWPKSYSENSYDVFVGEWFKPNHLGDIAKQCNEMVKKRQTGDSWPLNSFDITSIASVNIQMKLISKYKRTYSTGPKK